MFSLRFSHSQQPRIQCDESLEENIKFCNLFKNERAVYFNLCSRVTGIHETMIFNQYFTIFHLATRQIIMLTIIPCLSGWWCSVVSEWCVFVTTDSRCGVETPDPHYIIISGNTENTYFVLLISNIIVTTPFKSFYKSLIHYTNL